MFPVWSADVGLQRLLNLQWRSAFLDAVLPVFSLRWPLLVLLPALMVWRAALRGKVQVAYFILLVVAMGVSDLTCNTVKSMVPRLRPRHVLPGVIFEESGHWLRLPNDYVTDRQGGGSFPSAHAANSMTLALLAMLLWPRLKRGLWALPLVVGWSRVYMGNHYPTDVLAGWIIGVAIALFIWLVWKRLAPRLKLAVHPDETYRPFLLNPPECR